MHLSGTYSPSPVYLAISAPGGIEQTPMLYRQALKMLDHSFFAEGSLVITPQLHASSGISDDAPDMAGLIEAVTQAVAMGEAAQYTQLIERFFAFFRTAKIDIDLALTYCMELLMGMVRHCEPATRDRCVRQARASLESTSLGQYQALVQAVLAALAAQGAEADKSRLVTQALKYIDTHLGEADMTVSSLATKILFVRPDYFGKLFKKEMNVKPSEYIRDKRMQLARRALRGSDERVHAICAACGYGDNVQYFCHVFKQVVGVTPSQYREQKGRHPRDADWAPRDACPRSAGGSAICGLPHAPGRRAAQKAAEHLIFKHLRVVPGRQVEHAPLAHLGRPAGRVRLALIFVE